MQVTFFGAAGEVTGSCSLLETNNQKFLIDCGMFQGSEEHEKKNILPLSFDPRTLAAVFVTHAHLDHVGRLPLLAKNGFEGFVYATPPTRDLARLIMEDAYGVMEYDNRKFGKPLLYNMEDIEKIMTQFKTVKYHEPLMISDGVAVTFRDAGHVFGSAFIEIAADSKKVVFSGDVGNVDVPILPDTDALPSKIDALICESTYGDRQHESSKEREEMLRKVIAEVVRKKGVLMIPSFALERTQELLYALNDLIERDHKLKSVPIFLDSPLAIDTLKVFEKYPDYYDEEATKFFKEGDDIFEFPGLAKTYTRDESMKINHTPGPKIIIAGAGMMNGGRILHHALRYLSEKNNTILFIGYQSPGSLGWKILNGDRTVPVIGESIPVHCQVKMINAFSAHGDKEKLEKWVMNEGNAPRFVILNHGDKEQSAALAGVLKDKGIDVVPAEYNRSFEI